MPLLAQRPQGGCSVSPRVTPGGRALRINPRSETQHQPAAHCSRHDGTLPCAPASKHPPKGWMCPRKRMDVHSGKNGMKHRFPRITRVAIPALLAIATAACTGGPDFVRPEAAHGSAYSKSVPSAESATSVTYGGQVAEDWYELVHSAGLNELGRQG